MTPLPTPVTSPVSVFAPALLADLGSRLANAYADGVFDALPDVLDLWDAHVARAGRGPATGRVGEALHVVADNAGLLRKFVAQETEARFAARVNGLVGAPRHPHQWVLSRIRADREQGHSALEDVVIDGLVEPLVREQHRALQTITLTVDMLMGREVMAGTAARDHPAGPHVLAKSLSAALGPFSAGEEMRLSLLRAFGEVLPGVIGGAYEGTERIRRGRAARVEGEMARAA